jgi:hypothetical protein
MRSWVFLTLLGWFALLIPRAGPAQVADERTDAPVDTLPALDLPREVVEPILAFFNDPATIHFTGRARIPEERTIGGDVAVLGGPLIVAGRIEGSVLVIDGDVQLLPGAVITGDLTVVGGSVAGYADASIGGSLVSYSERLRFRRRGDRIGLDRFAPPESPTERDGWLARSDFLIASGRSYNRVEGLPITLGPVIETAGSNPLHLRAMAIYRSETGATLDPEQLGYYLRAEQYLGGHRALRVGGTLHSTIEPIEDWQVMNLENSLATFLLHRDLRDHYEREGWSGFVTLDPPRTPWDVSLSVRAERHGSVAAGSPWTLFRNHEAWRPQPLVGEGRVSLLGLQAGYDTRSSQLDPAHGWYVTASLERTLRSDLTRPAAIVAVPLPITDPEPVAAENFAGWTSGVLDIRRYNRLSPEGRLNLRLMLGGSLDGAALPPQRQHALGGEGSLPGYSLFRLSCGARPYDVFRAEVVRQPLRAAPTAFVPGYGCDQFALMQAEYRGKLSLRLGWGGSPWGDSEERGWDLGWAAAPEWVAFVDAGRGWAAGRRNEDLALDFGFGLLFSRVGVYVATPLAGEGGLNLFVRLGPRF